MTEFWRTFKNKTKYIKNLGEGAQGTVDLHSFNNEKVAVKNFFPDGEGDLHRETINEIISYHLLRGCPYLDQIIDLEILIIDDELTARIMKSYHTSTLLTFIKETPFSERVKHARRIFEQAINAISILYNKNIIHRDIKPANILIDYQYKVNSKELAGNIELYLTDFGTAIRLPCVDNRIEELSYDVTTPLYRAPELLAEQNYYDERSDIWSMGTVFVEYFLGKPLAKYSTFNFKRAQQNSDHAMIYQILDYLKHEWTFDDFINLRIRDHIDLKKIFINNLVGFQYQQLPANLITLIETMLNIDPNDRINIYHSVPNCGNIVGLDRGMMINNNVGSYYKIIHLLIKASKFMLLKPSTLIRTIDLFDRYLHNYNSKQLTLIAATCLFIIGKVNEFIASPLQQYAEIFGLEMNEIRDTQITILDNLNYIIMSCDYDEYIVAITDKYNKYPDHNLLRIYADLSKLYSTIEQDGKYAGDMFYFEIMEYLS